MKPLVYLCGGINGLSDADARNWRERVKARLPNTLDPMRRDYRGIEAGNADEIVAGDLDDIDACDIVLAMCLRPSWGTAMEIFYAYSSGKTVFIVAPDPLSPWLVAHSTRRFHSLGTAIDVIEAIGSWR